MSNEKTRAVILAGGEGTRLRPLTLTMPKPMVPIRNEPAMSHILRLLAAHGIDDAAVTLRYLGEQIPAYFGQRSLGVSLRYYREDWPLGTAGSVRRAAAGWTEDFLVISGDIVCEFDLTRALAFHREHNADATLILTRVTRPQEYGVVLCGGDGRVSSFMEKPSWKQTYADTVNTGVYILSPRALELIPDGEYDFGSQLFPRMLAEGRAICGFVDGGYWCDIGSPESYLACNLRMNDGKSVIGSGCEVADDALVLRSVLCDGARIGASVTLDGVIVCPNAVIGSASTAAPGSVIGAGALIGTHTHLASGVKIAPKVTLGSGLVVCEDVQNPSHSEGLVIRDDGIFSQGDPAFCLRLGAAMAKVCGRVGILNAPDEVSRLTAASLGCGLYAGGGEGCALGDGFPAMASFAAQRLAFPYVAYCTPESITLCDRYALTPPHETERRLHAAYREIAFDSTAQNAHAPVHGRRLDAFGYLYTLSLTDELHDMEDFAASFEDNLPGRYAAAALCSLGGNAEGTETRFSIAPAGDSLSLVSGECACDFWHALAILLDHEPENAPPLALPYTAPPALSDIAAKKGIPVCYCTDDSPASIRQAARNRLWMYDMCRASLRLCALLRTSTLAELLGRLPPFVCRTSLFDAEEEDKTRLLGSLSSADFRPDGEGLVYTDGNARVRVVPRRGRGFLLYADGFSTEAADELTHFTENLLRK